MRRNIVLTGLMGAGKSTVGKILAERLRFSLIDLDREIERAAKKSVAAIFAEAGEAAFRDLETQTLRALGGVQGVVVATGGGAPLRAENRVLMRELGDIVWLDVAPAVAAERTAGSDRPLLQVASPGTRLTALLAERRPAYADCDLAVDANGEAAAVAAEILARLSV